MNNKEALVHRPTTQDDYDEVDRAYIDGWNAANRCVVRCKDCKWEGASNGLLAICEWWRVYAGAAIPVNGDGFCSYGEAEAADHVHDR